LTRQLHESTGETERSTVRAETSRRFLLLLRGIVFSGLLFAEIAIQFWKAPFLVGIAGVLALLSWVLSLGSGDKTSRILSLALVGIGAGLFAVGRTLATVALLSFAENANVLMVMVLIPLLSIVIDLGGYSEALGSISQDLINPLYLYLVALFLSYAIGSVLLNAAIALAWTVLSPVVARVLENPVDFLVSSLPRGYDASLLWTPSSPAMAVALSLTGAHWTSLFWPGLILSFLMMALAVAVEVGTPLISPSSSQTSFAKRGEENDKWGERRKRLRAWRKTLTLAVGLSSFIVAVVLLESAGLTIFQAMIPCIGITLLLWSILLHKPRDAVKACGRYFSERLPHLSNQFLLMTTAGFIGTALRTTIQATGGIGRLADGLLGSNKLVFTLAASFLIWVISIAGIHPLIGMTIVYTLLSPLAQSFSRPHLALTLLLGSALGFNISPVSATILVTSSCARQNSIEAGLKHHWKFVLVAWLIGSTALSFLRI